jgi:hypothetical protein
MGLAERPGDVYGRLVLIEVVGLAVPVPLRLSSLIRCLSILGLLCPPRWHCGAQYLGCTLV